LRMMLMDHRCLNKYIILAAVGIGSFSIPYIITTIIIRHNNKRLGYPVHLESRVFPLTALTY
jgi:hypothetical protein